jgi:hypothetical protein
MRDSVIESLILDLLEWLAKRDRSYEETINAWRTSCPKLPVWEDANDRGLVALDVAESSFPAVWSRAKVTMRRSYGFRTFRILELALYHSLGKLPEPELTHEFF